MFYSLEAPKPPLFFVQVCAARPGKRAGRRLDEPTQGAQARDGGEKSCLRPQKRRAESRGAERFPLRALPPCFSISGKDSLKKCRGARGGPRIQPESAAAERNCFRLSSRSMTRRIGRMRAAPFCPRGDGHAQEKAGKPPKWQKNACACAACPAGAQGSGISSSWETSPRYQVTVRSCASAGRSKSSSTLPLRPAGSTARNASAKGLL